MVFLLEQPLTALLPKGKCTAVGPARPLHRLNAEGSSPRSLWEESGPPGAGWGGGRINGAHFLEQKGWRWGEGLLTSGSTPAAGSAIIPYQNFQSCRPYSLQLPESGFHYHYLYTGYSQLQRCLFCTLFLNLSQLKTAEVSLALPPPANLPTNL